MKYIKLYEQFINEKKVEVTKKQIFDAIWKLTSKGTAQAFVDELPKKGTYTSDDYIAVLNKWDKEDLYGGNTRWKINQAFDDMYHLYAK